MTKNTISSKFELLLIYILLNIICIKSDDCPKTAPIYDLYDCKLTYCNKEQFASEQCIIKNEIIKTQWLNNIIIIGDDYHRYINIASNNDGDIVIQTTAIPETTKRKFYGIKYNGRPFFTEDSKETLYYSKDISGQYIGHFEAQSLFVRVNNNNKEYFLSISKLQYSAEMFDLDTGEYLRKGVYDFTETDYIYSLRHALIPLSSSSPSSYTYLFGFYGKCGDFSSIQCIKLKKYQFNSESFYQVVSEGVRIDNGYGKAISCFETDNRLIICFFMMTETSCYFGGFCSSSNYFRIRS